MDSSDFDWDGFYSETNSDGPVSNEVIECSVNQPNELNDLNLAARDELETGVNQLEGHSSAEMTPSIPPPPNQPSLLRPENQFASPLNLGDCIISSPIYPVQTRDGLGVFIAGLNVVAGPQGGGKSTIIRKIVADITTASEAGAFVCDGGRPGKALVIAKEDDENSVLAPGIVANSGNPRNITFFSEREWRHNWLSEIESLLEQNPECKILLVDTVEAFAAKFGHNKITSKTVRQILDPLSLLGRRYGVAVVATCHLTKRQANRIVDQIGGSVELTGSARLVYSVSSHPQDQRLRVFESVKSNQRGHLERLVCRTEVLPLEDGVRLARNVGVTVDDNLAPDTFVRVNIVADEPQESDFPSIAEPSSPPPQRRESEANRCAVWIQEVLNSRNGLIATNELNQLAGENGFSLSTVGNARNILLHQSLIRSFRRGGIFWVSNNRVETGSPPEPSSIPAPAIPDPVDFSPAPNYGTRNRRCLTF